MASEVEVICEFMEPKPKPSAENWKPFERRSWWEPYAGLPRPCKLTLDRLREVEERLIESGPLNVHLKIEAEYRKQRGQLVLWHMSAEQKIKALAAVLRGGSDVR